MKRFLPLFIAMLVVGVGVGACIGEGTSPDDDAPAHDNADEMARPSKPAPIDTSESKTQPPSPGDVDWSGGPSSIVVTAAQCSPTPATPGAAPYGYPLSAPANVYCRCTTHADCANMPTAKECGTVFTSCEAGMSGCVYAFLPDGWPTICRQPGNMIVPTVP